MAKLFSTRGWTPLPPPQVHGLPTALLTHRWSSFPARCSPCWTCSPGTSWRWGRRRHGTPPAICSPGRRQTGWAIEEGRAASKKSPLNIWLFSFYFPAWSFCRYHFKIQLLETSTQKNRRNKDKSSKVSLFSDVFSLQVNFEFVCNLLLLLTFFAKFACLLKRLQRLKQEWQKSPAGTRQTYGKTYVRFREIERKLAKLSKTTFTYRSSS